MSEEEKVSGFHAFQWISSIRLLPLRSQLCYMRELTSLTEYGTEIGHVRAGAQYEIGPMRVECCSVRMWMGWGKGIWDGIKNLLPEG